MSIWREIFRGFIPSKKPKLSREEYEEKQKTVFNAILQTHLSLIEMISTRPSFDLVYSNTPETLVVTNKYVKTTDEEYENAINSMMSQISLLFPSNDSDSSLIYEFRLLIPLFHHQNEDGSVPMAFMNCRRIFCGPMNIVSRIPEGFGFGLFVFNVNPEGINLRTTSSFQEFREMIRSSLLEIRSLTVGKKHVEEPETFVVCFLKQSSKKKGKPPEKNFDALGPVANDNSLPEQRRAA